MCCTGDVEVSYNSRITCRTLGQCGIRYNNESNVMLFSWDKEGKVCDDVGVCNHQARRGKVIGVC